jgi:hypothetical protein
MVGGDVDLLDRIRPVLDPIAPASSTSVGHEGPEPPPSSPSTASSTDSTWHLSEALVLAEKAGVDRAIAYDVFASGAGGAPFVHYKREAYEHPEDAQVAFSLDLVAKDLELITGLARGWAPPWRRLESGLEIVAGHRGRVSVRPT